MTGVRLFGGYIGAKYHPKSTGAKAKELRLNWLLDPSDLQNAPDD